MSFYVISVTNRPISSVTVEKLTKTSENIKQKIEKDKEEMKAKLIPKYQRKYAEIENSMSKTRSKFDEIKN